MSISSSFLKKEGEDQIDEFIARAVESVTTPATISTKAPAQPSVTTQATSPPAPAASGAPPPKLNQLRRSRVAAKRKIRLPDWSRPTGGQSPEGRRPVDSRLHPDYAQRGLGRDRQHSAHLCRDLLCSAGSKTRSTISGVSPAGGAGFRASSVLGRDQPGAGAVDCRARPGDRASFGGHKKASHSHAVSSATSLSGSCRWWCSALPLRSFTP